MSPPQPLAVSLAMVSARARGIPGSSNTGGHFGRSGSAFMLSEAQQHTMALGLLPSSFLTSW